MRKGEEGRRPPLPERWREIVRQGSALAYRHGVEVLYKMWSEPDVVVDPYWRGNLARYMELLRDGAAAARAVYPSAKIVNGGLILGEIDREGYLAYAIEALKAATLDVKSGASPML